MTRVVEVELGGHADVEVGRLRDAAGVVGHPAHALIKDRRAEATVGSHVGLRRLGTGTATGLRGAECVVSEDAGQDRQREKARDEEGDADPVAHFSVSICGRSCHHTRLLAAPRAACRPQPAPPDTFP